ncbi:hypothetical protein [Ornithinimicrobium kibberense]|uniref:hypothetical protein n=1 Tax=Ornithinimicrobium kibberense TaxID=282060 RepID=UPI0036232509
MACSRPQSRTRATTTAAARSTAYIARWVRRRLVVLFTGGTPFSWSGSLSPR